MWTPADRALVGDFGSDQALTDDQFRLLEPLIPPAKLGGRPRSTDIRNLLDGIFYLVPARRAGLWGPGGGAPPRPRKLPAPLAYAPVVRGGNGAARRREDRSHDNRGSTPHFCRPAAVRGPATSTCHPCAVRAPLRSGASHRRAARAATPA